MIKRRINLHIDPEQNLRLKVLSTLDGKELLKSTQKFPKEEQFDEEPIRRDNGKQRRYRMWCINNQNDFDDYVDSDKPLDKEGEALVAEYVEQSFGKSPTEPLTPVKKENDEFSPKTTLNGSVEIDDRAKTLDPYGDFKTPQKGAGMLFKKNFGAASSRDV